MRMHMQMHAQWQKLANVKVHVHVQATVHVLS